MLVRIAHRCRAARFKSHAYSAGLSRGACGAAVVVFFRPRDEQGQGRQRRRIGQAGFDAAKHLSGPEDQLRDRARQRALDRLQQSILVLGVHDAEDAREPDRPDQSYDAFDAANPVVAVKSERRDRCPADGGSQRSRIGIWRLQRHRIADQYVRLVGVHDQQLECGISG